MAYIVHRRVRGRRYRYWVESYRDEQGQPRQKNRCFGAVPELPEDAPIGVVLFAGGGGVEAGMVMAGIRPVLSVEFDPGKPELSRALAQSNHLNFKPYGSRVIKRTVEDLANAGFPNFPRNPIRASYDGRTQGTLRICSWFVSPFIRSSWFSKTLHQPSGHTRCMSGCRRIRRFQDVRNQVSEQST